MTCLLIVAKAPVAGLAKTRLIPHVGARRAARIAAAAMLDTLDVVLATPGVLPVVAVTGDVSTAERSDELAVALAGCTVIPQHGHTFAARLVNAHRDLIHYGRSVLQIGMDTPQVSADLLAESIERLHEPGVDAVLGPATDGGWWALGLRSPEHARALHAVAMSRSDTGRRTWAALHGAGRHVAALPKLSDVDTLTDAVAVAELAPGGRFAAEVGATHHAHSL